MSGALAVLGTAATFGIPALAQTDLVPAWIRQGRKIGTIIPDVTIEEQHADRLNVTQHPIADGSPISDHAYRLPATVTMRCGWSNANLAGTLTSALLSGTSPWGGFTETRAREVYTRLRELQGTPDGRPPQLFDITTGKRAYKNMALTELSVSTDHTKEYTLFVEAHFTEVFLVRTRSTSQPATQDMLGSGSKTAATQDEPGKQPEEVSGLQATLGRALGTPGTVGPAPR